MNIMKKIFFIFLCLLFSGFCHLFVFTIGASFSNSIHFCCCGEGMQDVCACKGNCCNHSESAAIGVVFTQCGRSIGYTESPIFPFEFLLVVPSCKLTVHRILDYIEYPDCFNPIEFLNPIDKPPENTSC